MVHKASVVRSAPSPGGTGVPAGWDYGDLVSQHRGATSRWFHFDALGSTDRLTDSTGAATDSYVYKAFGPLAASTGSTTNPFRYVGQLGYYDHTTGPLYIRARWLRPTTGSWLSADPVEGEPAYRYNRGVPTGATDPSGLQGDVPKPPTKDVCKVVSPGGGGNWGP